MKFSSSAVISALVFASGAAAFNPSVGHTVRQQQPRSALSSTTEEAAAVEEKKPSKKDDRLRMMKSDQFYRRGFKEVRENVEDVMQQQFKSELVDDMKTSNYVVEREGVKVHLAKVRSTR
jgi:4-hydroxy-3-methylbut-2-enyl diphosphate reductase